MKKAESYQAPVQIRCPSCASSARFVEVMAEEAHIVDGTGKYIKLLEGIVDHFICLECGKSFPPEESAVDECAACR